MADSGFVNPFTDPVDIFGLKVPAGIVLVVFLVVVVVAGVVVTANQDGGSGNGSPSQGSPPSEASVGAWLKAELPNLAGPASEILIHDARDGDMYVSIFNTGGVTESSCLLLSYSGGQVTSSFPADLADTCPAGIEVGP